MTGLLGPNGAGKTTVLHMMAGFLAPSRGTVLVGGAPAWRNPAVYRRLGLVSEREAVHGFLTGWEFVLASAKLHRLADPAAAARRAVELVEMTDAKDRRIDTYSKGMRQRIRVAAALVHDPAVLLLDEPFNGMDPRQRMHMMELLHGMGDQGRTVLFSSHILEEVEQVSGTVQVIVAGRLAASGDYRTIRRLMTNRPHVFTIRSSDDRRARGRADGRGLGGRRRARRGRRPDRARGRLRHLHPCPAEDGAGPAASGCNGSCRPTSPWKASSPTWWVPECSTSRSPGSPPGRCSAAAGSCCCCRCPRC